MLVIMIHEKQYLRLNSAREQSLSLNIHETHFFLSFAYREMQINYFEV